jgi:phosphoribosylaminoimidazolecarboxamide formyltransferase/IMP cyclohydrolase
MTPQRIQRALISVSNKTGLVELAHKLQSMGVEILSTGGTARALRDAGIAVIEISEFTGFPEILDGRVKTLHPKVHGGILFLRDESEHRRAIERHGIRAIDMVVVNLYPFQETSRRPGVSREEAIEQIDIGGPSMLRSAAKNHAAVTVVCSPERYGEVIDDLEQNGGASSEALRRRLAAEAFRHTGEYDRAIAEHFARLDAEGHPAAGEAGAIPDRLEIALALDSMLRYGENPHQGAGFYGDFERHFHKLHGKELSYNNILDLSAAVELIEEFPAEQAAVAIIKHTNPCGIALGADLREAWNRALATDPDAASGGIAAFNRPIDVETANRVHSFFTEIIAAPDFDPGALEVLEERKHRILIRCVLPLRQGTALSIRSAAGGVLVQEPDRGARDASGFRAVTRRAPTAAEMEGLLFAWKVVKHLKSNAIAFCSGDRSLGLGAGQMSRVDAARVAVMKARQAGIELKGSVAASDAFFPFADGLVVCADAGATAAIQPGGSKRDEEVIQAADERGMAMVFTGERHFRH